MVCVVAAAVLVTDPTLNTEESNADSICSDLEYGRTYMCICIGSCTNQMHAQHDGHEI